MIDTILILFLIFGAVGLYSAFGIIRDHYTNGPLFDEEGDQAGHKRFVHGCIAFVVFYFAILFMTVLAPMRPYAMLTFSAGLALFLLTCVVSEIGRNQISPLFFKSSSIVTRSGGRYAGAVAWNLLFVAAALYWVVAEFQAVVAQ